MPSGRKYAVVALVVALIALWLLPGWLAAVVILAVLAIPIVAYVMLDPSQRRRLRRVRRKQIGR